MKSRKAKFIVMVSAVFTFFTALKELEGIVPKFSSNQKRNTAKIKTIP